MCAALESQSPEVTTKELIAEVAEQDKALRGAEALVQAEKQSIDEVQNPSFAFSKIAVVVVVVVVVIVVGVLTVVVAVVLIAVVVAAIVVKVAAVLAAAEVVYQKREAATLNWNVVKTRWTWLQFFVASSPEQPHSSLGSAHRAQRFGRAAYFLVANCSANDTQLRVFYGVPSTNCLKESLEDTPLRMTTAARKTISITTATTAV